MTRVKDERDGGEAVSAPDRPRGLYKAPFTLERPEKVSQSCLARIDVCPYSGALYLKHRDDNVQTHRMAGGEMAHYVFERLTTMALENGWETIPPEVAKDYAQAWIEERVDLALTADEQEAVRTAAWNWASAMVFDHEAIVGVEQMFEYELAGWTIRGKLDLVEIIPGSGIGIVTDYKTSLRLPSIEEYGRDFQAQCYALLLHKGTPEGESMALGRGLSAIKTKQVFPRYAPEGGELLHRHATFEPKHLWDFERVLEAHLAKLAHGLETGEWAASPGTHCNTCPAASECPIPAEVRRTGAIVTEGQALELAESIGRRERELRDDKDALKAYVDERGVRLVVGDEAWDFHLERREGIKDKGALKAFITEHGAQPEDFFKTSVSTRFKRARIKEAA